MRRTLYALICHTLYACMCHKLNMCDAYLKYTNIKIGKRVLQDSEVEWTASNFVSVFFQKAYSDYWWKSSVIFVTNFSYVSTILFSLTSSLKIEIRKILLINWPGFQAHYSWRPLLSWDFCHNLRLLCLYILLHQHW